MNWINRIHYLIFVAILVLMNGCADVESDPVLQVLKVNPETHTATINAQPKQFYAVGYYDDGSTRDLTQTATWTDDSTSDSLLSSEFPGLVYFRQVGWFAIVATFEDASADADYNPKAKSEIQITN